MTKAELRDIYLAKQKALTPAERETASRRIAHNFFTLFNPTSFHTLHSFLTIEKFNEIDTTPIIHCLWKNHPQIRVAVPRVDFESGEMESILYTAETETKQNHWLIPEPLKGELIEASVIDLVIAPLVCADKAGHRVGYGKGFYDRFLKQVRPNCLKVGLSYFEPVDAIVDVHEGDVALDTLVTPDGIHRLEKTTPSFR